jgi:hypothetical protein
MRLRPITYNLDVMGIRSHLGQKAPSDAGTRQSIAAREKELLSGFAAQEVEAAALEEQNKLLMQQVKKQ